MVESGSEGARGCGQGLREAEDPARVECVRGFSQSLRELEGSVSF